MSRASKAYASRYLLDRVHASTLPRGSKRTYAVDFNGALDSGETIASATWSTDTTSTLTLTGLTGSAGVVSVTAEAALSGCVVMTCLATTSAGRKLSQSFQVWIREPVIAGEGASTLTWTA